MASQFKIAVVNRGLPRIFSEGDMKGKYSQDPDKGKKSISLPAPLARLLSRVQSESKLSAMARNNSKKTLMAVEELAVHVADAQDDPWTVARRHSMAAIQQTLAVPQIALRRRSTGYEDDIALIKSIKASPPSSSLECDDAMSVTSSSSSSTSSSGSFDYSKRENSDRTRCESPTSRPEHPAVARLKETIFDGRVPRAASICSEGEIRTPASQIPGGRSRHMSLASDSELERFAARRTGSTSSHSNEGGSVRSARSLGTARRHSMFDTKEGLKTNTTGILRSTHLPVQYESDNDAISISESVSPASSPRLPPRGILSERNTTKQVSGTHRSRQPSLNKDSSVIEIIPEKEMTSDVTSESCALKHPALRTVSDAECGDDTTSLDSGSSVRYRHANSTTDLDGARHRHRHHHRGHHQSGSEDKAMEGPHGSLFTARLFNRIGNKGVLRNVSHVSHVYKGTILITDLLASKILYSARSGRTAKEFVAEMGSEPWCACITPRGHVAVTLRRGGCVTVWSGNGQLVREFGHDVLQCPTGLGCDGLGRFIVTDERTNRVSLFTPQGEFLRYLGYANDDDNDQGDDDNGDDDDSGDSSDNENNNNIVESRQRSRTRTNSEKRVRIMSPSRPGVVVFPDGGREDDVISLQSASASASDAPTPLIRSGKNSNSKVGDKRSGGSNNNSSSSKGSISHDGSNKGVVGEGLDDHEPFVFNGPRYVCVTGSGWIVVSDSGSNSVKVFTSDGNYHHSIGQYGSGDGCLKVPYGVCCDHHDNIYIADHYNDRVSVFSLDGKFLQHALVAESGLVRPKSLAIRPAHVRLYVAHGGLRSTEVLVYRLERDSHEISFKCDL